jgi:hypothetical protein
MNLCANCSKNLIIKGECIFNIYEEKKVCLECYEVLDFMEESKPLKLKKEQVVNKAKTIYICNICKKNYDGIKCNDCNFTNPLCRKKKKK